MNLKSLYHNRCSLKIAGASGQGINTLGEILGKALKRGNYYTFAYREYPSLIKGGHATYQIDYSGEKIEAATQFVDIVVVLNRQMTKWHLPELKPGGIIVHDIIDPRISRQELKEIQAKNIKLIYVPALELSEEVGGNELTSNIVTIGFLWQLLGQELVELEEIIKEIFADKPQFIPIDIDCARQGFQYSHAREIKQTKRYRQQQEISLLEKKHVHVQDIKSIAFAKCKPTDSLDENSILISGNEALAIGAVNAEAKMHFAYPMTPSSSILSYLASKAMDTGMIVKQAESEITAAAMAIGAMHAGKRALTATSGGGFDLMTEHVSLAAITEIPFVCVIAQRPGPATGLPTWTAQADLNLALYGGHGEFTRCVIACRDAEDAFYKIQIAFNIAEKYQIPVLVLTDKLIAESLHTVGSLDLEKVPVERNLITDAAALTQLQSTDRYKLTESGISARWAPGRKAPDFNANSDEHDEEGNVVEDAEPAAAMLQKRLRKEESLKAELPKPEIYFNELDFNEAIDHVRLMGWGSTFGAVQDTFDYFTERNIKIDYLDISYLWPLEKDFIKSYLQESSMAILIEGNATGQLGELIKRVTGIEIKHKFLKADGRPFYPEEIIKFIEEKLS